MDRERILDQLFRLLYVARNAACHHALSKYKNEFKQNYWILIYNNFLDIAILEWCKVFGSHNESTHWKSLVEDHDSFRQCLLNALGIDHSIWENYCRNMKDYRDKFVAHHQKDPSRTHYPSLEDALKSSFYYYNFLINKLVSLRIDFEPHDLRDYYYAFLDQAKKFSDVSYQASKDIEEKVY